MVPVALGEACVALAGLGGVGGICARTIVDCGVSSLRAADYGFFEPMNYPCQFFAMPQVMGKAKAEVVAKALAVNSQTAVEVFHGDLTEPDQAGRLVSGAQIVISALDNYGAQAAVALVAEAANLPFALVSVVGLTGMHTVYFPGEHSFTAQWRRFGYDLNKPAAADAGQSMTRQQLLYAFAMGGFRREALETMLDDHANGRPLSYFNLAGVNYAGATLAINNILGLLTGQGRAVCFPEILCFDFFGCRVIRADELRRRILAVNQAFYRGRAALLDTVRSWQGGEEWT